MDKQFNAAAIYEAGRRNVSDAIGKPGERARKEHGQLSVSQFKRIATLVWQEQPSKAKIKK